MRIDVQFDLNWIYEGGGIHSFASSLMIRALRQRYGDEQIDIIDSRIDGFTVDLLVDDDPERVSKVLLQLSRDAAHLDNPDLMQVTIRQQQPQEPSAPPAPMDEESADAQWIREVRSQIVPPAVRGGEAQPATPSDEPKSSDAAGAGSDEGAFEALAAAGDVAAAEAAKAAAGAEIGSENGLDAETGSAETAATLKDGKKAKKTTLQQVDELIGFTAFKELCHEIADRAPMVHENGTEEVFFARCYLFAINSGEGLSRVLSLLKDTVLDAGYFAGGVKPDVREVELPSMEGEHAEERFANFMGSLDSVYARERVVCYDISEWVGHTGKEQFKEFLLRIFREERHCINVFRMPLAADRILSQTLEDLADVLTVEQIVFAQHTTEETRKLAEQMLSDYDITVAQNAWEKFDRRISLEKQNGFFYGMHTLRKVTNEMVLQMEDFNVLHQLEGKVITPEKIEALSPSDGKDLRGETRLDALVGMTEVKKQLRSIMNQIMVAQSGAVKTRPGMHMCFVGAPGTGKTTVARLVGEILAERKLLRSGRFYEYRGRDLCGRYVGETAIKTREICREAYGSVLFIDEAYSLFRGDHSTVDFGREAIDTLIAEMENHAEELVVILAGYSEDMETMLTANAGMSSRIPYTLEFPNYSRKELCEIFMKFIPDTMDYDEEFTAEAKKFFDKLPQSLLDSRDFGNGRFSRNLYERTWGRAVSERIIEPGERIRLTKDDLDAAGAELLGKSSDRRRPIGF